MMTSLLKRGFSVPALAVQLVEIAIFIPLILFGLSRLGAYFLRKVSDEENTYFALMLLVMTVAAALAALINLPGIVGANVSVTPAGGSGPERPTSH
jgi:Kef-type K+ transport system membrane component KefB